MKQTMKHWMLVATLTGTASFVVACGGGKDEEENEPKGASMSSVTSALESPTGILDETTAADVGRAFEESLGAPTGGNREMSNPVVAQNGGAAACPNGGDLSATAASDGSSVAISYNDCCQTVGCCLDGSISTFTDTSGTATYSTCIDYDISASCDGVDGSYSFAYCSGSAGVVYAIEIEGDTFAVSGSMSNGNGTLTITSENGTFSCTYTNYSGSCTDSTGGSFSF